MAINAMFGGAIFIPGVLVMLLGLHFDVVDAGTPKLTCNDNLNNVADCDDLVIVNGTVKQRFSYIYSDANGNMRQMAHETPESQIG